MILEFKEQFRLPVAKVYSYFETPADWARVFGLKGTSKDLGDGWYEVPLKNFPFPLVARNTEQEPGKMVRWVFRGLTIPFCPGRSCGSSFRGRRFERT